jgi:hypothetical protein
MEDLDSLAGSIAYKHMLEPGASQVGQGRGFYIVTASVERSVLFAFTYGHDLTGAGEVSTCSLSLTPNATYEYVARLFIPERVRWRS